MSISEWIQGKKKELFLARDADKLELQKAELSKERERLQKQRNLEDEVRKEQRQIRELRSKPSRDRFAALSSGFKSIAEGVNRGSERIERLGGGPNPNSPFYAGNPFGPDKPKISAPQKKGRTIVVNIKE